ncbi:MAG: aminotransferase class I/II-fold pyridoxal phosphate-dependent enzyme [Limnochordaceae bacterium]|nr:aminotransferase class I/II-fold pyridoxal phosphate-dependent enzyme [Limnochordaceae bacterium]
MGLEGTDRGDSRLPGYRLDTLSAQAGRRRPVVIERPVAPPIFQTSVFEFESLERMAEVEAEQGSGPPRNFSYSREANPTVATLERAVADLEGAEDAWAAASGMGAIFTTLWSLLAPGDHVAVAAEVYGGTYRAVTQELARFGVRFTQVDTSDLEAVRAALRPETRVLYVETISNPTLKVADLPALAQLARRHGGCRLVVDNTFASPVLCRPLELGADLVVESATKFLGGHADVTPGRRGGFGGAGDPGAAAGHDPGGGGCPVRRLAGPAGSHDPRVANPPAERKRRGTGAAPGKPPQRRKGLLSRTGAGGRACAPDAGRRVWRDGIVCYPGAHRPGRPGVGWRRSCNRRRGLACCRTVRARAEAGAARAQPGRGRYHHLASGLFVSPGHAAGAAPAPRHRRHADPGLGGCRGHGGHLGGLRSGPASSRLVVATSRSEAAPGVPGVSGLGPGGRRWRSWSSPLAPVIGLGPLRNNTGSR